MLALGIGVLWSFRESMFKARLWSWKSNQNQFSPGVFILIAYLREFWSFSAFPERICDENSQKSICTRFLQFVLLSNVQIHSHSLSQSISSEFELRLAEAGSFGNGENSAAVCSISEWGRNNEIISTPINPNLVDQPLECHWGKKWNKTKIKNHFLSESYLPQWEWFVRITFIQDSKNGDICGWLVSLGWKNLWANRTISGRPSPLRNLHLYDSPFPSHWRWPGL